MSKTVLVTGATGFLGSAISNALQDGGWDVIRCARKLRADAGANWRCYDLAVPLPEGFLSDVDVVVHAAYVQLKDEPNSYSVNVHGSARLIEAARQAAARFVFISSLSAAPAARSQYGRQKFAIEGLVDPKRDLVVRPGLVLGLGGIFGRLLQHIRAGRPVPLVDGGGQPLQTIYLDDLVAALQTLLLESATGHVILAETPSIPYATFFRALAARSGVRGRFVTVPSWLLLAFADLARSVHIPSPVDRDNILGLLDMHFVDPAANSVRWLPRIRSSSESIDALFSLSGAR